MSKIHNAVYGLALGDAFGFITERMRFPDIIEKYGAGRYLPTDRILQISDDTQMSIVTIEAIRKMYGHAKGKKFFTIGKYLAEDYVKWMDSGEPRGAGKATINSLKELKKNRSDIHAFGQDSKGSGTVMRAPWIGLCSFIPNAELEDFTRTHSLITHNSDSTTYSAYLTSLITRKLYEGTLECGDIRDFALTTLDAILYSGDLLEQGIHDVDEIFGYIDRINALPSGWMYQSPDGLDICNYTGQAGRGDMVLAAAIALTDAFGTEDPIQGIHRAMLTGGDSDTIGAVAGAFIGAANEEDIWEDLPDVLEDEYVEQLEDVIDYLEFHA